MNNITRLHKVIKYLSEKTTELNEGLSSDNLSDMNAIFNIAMKIIWLCESILRDYPSITIIERDTLNIELLLSNIYQPYITTFESFYAYLCKWKEDIAIPYELRQAMKSYKQAQTQPVQIQPYYCEELQYRFDLDY